MPKTMRRPSPPVLTDIEETRGAAGEVVFDTAFVARMLDRLIVGRLQDLDELQQGREILVGLHKQASGGEVIASVDARTSLPNRKAFSAHLSEALKRLAPTRPLCLVLIEVGALQLLANEVGAGVANRVVKRFAAILQRTVKRTDYVARIGPQHFVLIFEDILPEKAVRIALRVHEAIEAKMSTGRAPVADLLSVTMGVASATGSDHSADDLLQKAHDAVVQARKEGRPAIYVA